MRRLASRRAAVSFARFSRALPIASPPVLTIKKFSCRGAGLAIGHRAGRLSPRATRSRRDLIGIALVENRFR
jgi:hypothetical protein